MGATSDKTARHPADARAESATSRFAQLVGIGIYILVAASGAAAGVYSVAFFFEFKRVFQMNISIVDIVAAVTFFTVLYALYKSHAQYIRGHMSGLRRQSAIKSKIANSLGMIASIAMIVTATLLVRQNIERPSPGRSDSAQTEARPQNPTPNTSQYPPTEPNVPETKATPTVPIERGSEPTRVTTAAPVPGPKDHTKEVCDLNEEFSKEELEACLEDIRRHPRQTGVGGPAYRWNKEGSKWKLNEHSPTNPVQQQRNKKAVPPLDLRPPSR